jgi:hypothetical protein
VVVLTVNRIADLHTVDKPRRLGRLALAELRGVEGRLRGVLGL